MKLINGKHLSFPFRVGSDGRMTTVKTLDEHVRDELGDVLWYVAALSHELGLEMDEVARANLEKLNSRKARGALGGSGDRR